MFVANKLNGKQVLSPGWSDLNELLLANSDQYHCSLQDLTSNNPCLFVFLRSFACCFCRESLQDLKAALPLLEQDQVKPVLVHMSSEEEASQILARYGLADLSRVCDPQRSLYAFFGLNRSSIENLISPKVIARALGTVIQGNSISVLAGDPLQMHGVFLIHKGRLLSAYKAQSVDNRPDYVRIARVVYSPLS